MATTTIVLVTAVTTLIIVVVVYMAYCDAKRRVKARRRKIKKRLGTQSHKVRWLKAVDR